MTQQLAEAAGSWRARSGVAFILLLAALATVFALRSADAAVPSTTISASDNGPVGGGETLTYSFAFTFTGTVAAEPPSTFSFVVDDNLTFLGTGSGDIGAIESPADCSQTGTTVTCTDAADVSNWINDTLTLDFLVDAAGGTITPPALATCTLSDAGAGSATCTDGGLTAEFEAENAVTVDPVTATNLLGDEEVFTFTLPANYVCATTDNLATPVRECAAGDVNITGDLTLVSVVPDGSNWNQEGTVAVTVVNDGPNAETGTVSLDVVEVAPTINGGGIAPVGDPFISQVGTKTYVNAELRHMSDRTTADAIGILPVGAQEVANNVRGSRHVICAVQEDTAIDLNGDGDFTDVAEPAGPFGNDVWPVPALIPISTITDINFQSGGGYTSINDPDPTETDLKIFIGNGIPLHETGGNGGMLGATCFSWVSTQAGDQEINVVYTGDDGASYSVNWDTNLDDNDNDGVEGDGNVNNSAIIKEWNVLENSVVTADGVSFGPFYTTLNGVEDEDSEVFELDVPASFNPATGLLQFADIDLSDVFWGSHINRAGGLETHALVGVNWTISHSGCGEFEGTTVLSGTTKLDSDGSVFDNPTLTLGPGSTCTIGSTATVTFTGSEPGPLGSGAGNTITQVVQIRIIPPANPSKYVLLAWAGQRVMVEHDWRVPAGDVDGGTADEPDNLGECPFGGDEQEETYFLVQGIRGSGPGNFLPALGANVLGNDNAFVTVKTEEHQEDDEVPGWPQENCISRLIYESEDQGQVDLELFVYGMAGGRAESNGVSVDAQHLYPPAETRFFTPLQFQSTKIAYVIYYMKLNQVNVSLVTSVEKPNHNGAGDFAPGNPWDASADVTEADWNVSADLLVRGRVTGWFTNSNPSGRARDDSDPNNVLPADRWVMPTDWGLLQGGACGFDCRPEYDYMFAPNSGVVLDTPEGNPVTNDTFFATVFEGPFSTLDIPGLAGQGLGGAALSDWDPNNIRDTRFGDRVLDWWDAPMPPAPVTVDINGAGFIREVLKQDVYYVGPPNGDAVSQDYPNPYYITDIPESPFLPAFQAGGGFLWDTWGADGPGGPGGQGVYRFWEAVIVGANIAGSPGQVISAALQADLDHAQDVYGDDTIARRLTVFSDNHGEFMVQANGDANLDFSGCNVNLFSGAPHCSQGDSIGVSTISATADYPDFRGKHFPVSTNVATVNWTWGGYKEVTVEEGETDQFKYIVLHELDRDGSCRATGSAGPISLNPALGIEVDWIIDSDEGGRIIDAAHLDEDDGLGGRIEITNQSATTTTYSTAEPPHGHIKFDPINGSEVECQTWIKLSNSLLGRTNVFIIAHNPEGDVGFDVIIDFTTEVQYTLNFRWSLITWAGADGISPMDALSGTGANEGGTNILDQVTAVYGWQQQSQTWLSFFPDGVGVPGANDLTALNEGDAYWIAIRGPNSINWTVVTDVN